MKNYEQILLKVSFMQTIMFFAEMLCRLIFSEQVNAWPAKEVEV